MNKKLGIGVIALTLAVAACSSDGVDETAQRELDEFNNTTTAPPDSTSTTSNSTTPVETEPPTTETVETPPSTDAASTTAAPSASTTTTTVDLLPEEQIEATVELTEQQWVECLRELPDCDAEARTAGRTGEERDNAIRVIFSYNSNGYVAQDIELLDYRLDSVEINPNGTSATGSVCVTDAASLFESDGTTPVDIRFLSSIQAWEFLFDGSSWAVSNRVIVGEIQEGEANNACLPN